MIGKYIIGRPRSPGRFHIYLDGHKLWLKVFFFIFLYNNNKIQLLASQSALSLHLYNVIFFNDTFIAIIIAHEQTRKTNVVQQ